VGCFRRWPGRQVRCCCCCLLVPVGSWPEWPDAWRAPPVPIEMAALLILMCESCICWVDR